MMMSRHSDHSIGAVFDNPDDSLAVFERLIKHDFPMNQISILYRTNRLGDDFLGDAYTNEKERSPVA
jgi:hypothetical protein